MYRKDPPLLLIDDEEQILLSYEAMLISEGLENIHSLSDSRQVLPLLEKQNVSVIVLDLNMPHLSGLSLLEKIREKFPDIAVIVVTAVNELDNAVKCMKRGAVDYIVKPVEQSRFIASIGQALKISQLSEEVSSLKHHVSSLKTHLISDQLENEEAFSDYITASKKMKGIFHYIEAIASHHIPVLIQGETGVGKELLSRAIHNSSKLEGNFVALNIAGLDDNMFSDALFGHKKGAFTNADSDRNGFIVHASEGTLLLDEIGDLSQSSQVKLLRLLEDGVFFPLGSDQPQQCKARIIASTNRDLLHLMSKGKFRKDLYYRLVSAQINVPPLRERKEDIPALVDFFLGSAAESLHKKKPSVPRELLILLTNYHYPGNIRELKAMIFDAVARHTSGVLSLNYFKEFIRSERQDINPDLLQGMGIDGPVIDLTKHFPTIHDVVELMVEEALKRSQGNQGIAASMLGITRQALNRRLNKDPKTG